MAPKKFPHTRAEVLRAMYVFSITTMMLALLLTLALGGWAWFFGVLFLVSAAAWARVAYEHHQMNTSAFAADEGMDGEVSRIWRHKNRGTKYVVDTYSAAFYWGYFRQEEIRDGMEVSVYVKGAADNLRYYVCPGMALPPGHADFIGKARLQMTTSTPESGDAMVVYRDIDDRNSVWCRPYTEFTDGRFEVSHA